MNRLKKLMIQHIKYKQKAEAV